MWDEDGYTVVNMPRLHDDDARYFTDLPVFSRTSTFSQQVISICLQLQSIYIYIYIYIVRTFFFVCVCVCGGGGGGVGSIYVMLSGGVERCKRSLESFICV